MKKILIVTINLHFGGTERSIVNTAKLLSNNNQLKVHLLNTETGYSDYKISENVIYQSLNHHIRNNKLANIKVHFLRMYEVYKYAKKNNIELVFAFAEYNLFVCTLLVLFTRIEIIYSQRNRYEYNLGSLIEKFVRRYLIFKTNKIITQTFQQKQQIHSKGNHQNITVIPNSLPYYNYDSIKFEEKEEIILCVSRFDINKRIDHVIRIFENIDSHNYKLVIIGNYSSNYNAIKELAIKSKKSIKIELIINCSSIFEFYRKAKIFMLASASEGFPNSLLEAKFAGCALLSYDVVSGPKEIIEQNVSGYLIEDNNIQEYINKLQFLVENRDLLDGIIKNNLSLDSKSYNNEIYKRLMALI